MEKRQYFGGAMISYIAIIFNVVLGILYTPWMVGKIGQSSYALYTIANSVISIFMIDFGLSAAVSRFVAKYRAENEDSKSNKLLGSVTILYILIDILIFIILMVIYLNIATIYKGLSFDELKVLKRLFVIVAIYSLLAFPFTPLGGIITAYEKFIHLKLCDFIYKILTVVFVIIALLHDYGVEAVVLASVFSGICAIILKLFIIYKKTPVRYCFTWVDKKLLKSIFTFSVWMTVSSIAQRCVFNIAPSVLAYTSSSKEVALFAPANTLEGYFYMIAAAVNGMFLAKISKLIADSKEHEIVNLMINVGKYQTILMGFILVGFICVGEDFMRLWMGVEYVGSWPCAILLFIPDILLFSQQIANTTAIAQNKVKKISLAYVAMAFVCIALSLVLGKWIGALGSCVAIMLGHIALFIISNVVYYKELNIDVFLFYKKVYMPFVFPCIGSVFLGYWLCNYVITIDGWSGLFVKGIMISAIYILAIISFMFNSNERSKIIRLLRGV
ncbi:hypothetical protein DW243_16830 [Mediterraneibacter gnavus]|jgi:O-antigen/teichoic acid export membrane protein|uniref:Polysaccharide biosynthesis protein C-terminal domain-containing protein n=1 Tax=Mediterraneibacter gnavus TaxID=33038 RepID=A0A414URJ5_MEDGN|nr:oligosaccharide flippase family protein [Mediterraneibacter gnavus]RHG67618.1 hypothetical protein DW248_16175 [Mediterraneibacter gnavus]RHG79098.1 hypothetical protein DW243_16830 [Mediterraneibacter gnavus]